MYQQQTVVKCTSGLYNEQVTYFVQKANEFRCNILAMTASGRAASGGR